MPDAIASAFQAVLGVRCDPVRLRLVFDRSAVPMVVVDDQRRHLSVNRAGRLAMRLSMAELGHYRIDDLTPPDVLPSMRTAWAQLIETGYAAGRHELASPDGGRLKVRYWALAGVLSAGNLIAFAPASWPEHELGLAGEGGAAGTVPRLTSREREVLQLAAEGLSGPGIALALVISHATVRTHFRNIYEKLGVGERPAAVAMALRLGLIA